MQTSIFARQAWLPEGWASDVRISLVGQQIASLERKVRLEAGDVQVDVLVPGMSNLHSHAFQRAMAGFAERRGAQADSFWTWRDLMYRLSLSLTPDEFQAIAEMAYIEMLENGFTRVGEFHYLHHGAEGQAYANHAEMSLRIFAAAENTGIALTHLPVFYAHSGFSGKPPQTGQRRFIHTPDDFLKLHKACRSAMTRPQDRLGFAPHSLRACTPQELDILLHAIPDGPVHIHIAEQTSEVAESISHLGKRPVEWLLGKHKVDSRWCLVHATHVNAEECQAIAASGAVVGLCPITEANLGDGLFPAEDFLAEGGVFGIGSDSNVEISVPSELRLLEYGQRLQSRARNVLSGGQGSTGEALYQRALSGGAQALNAPQPVCQIGASADLVGYDDPQQLHDGSRAIDRLIFAKSLLLNNVWASGNHVVSHGQHHQRDTIATRFKTTLQKVLGR